jgi:hypothetical protein
VVAPAVGLDDEAMGREVEVDLVRVVFGVGDDQVAERAVADRRGGSAGGSGARCPRV